MNCIFGLFDVLGFTSFCENCDFRNAERVLKTMDDFETEIPEMLLHDLAAGNNIPQEKKDLLKNRLKWLTFSDTVFVAMPFEATEHPEMVRFNLIFFTLLAAYINRKMFEIGLPLRGTVHIGDLVISKRCFVGKAVIEAHSLSKKCQVAATIVSDEAHKLLFKMFSEASGDQFIYANLIVECDIPTGIATLPNSTLCGYNSERMRTLCWLFLGMGRIGRFVIPSDLNTYVREKFTAHGKKLVGDKEKMKTLNTAKLFQDWKASNSMATMISMGPQLSS